ncbi:MAG: acyl-CoA dehydrogenase family protein [Desulfobacterium sp.]|nr:acyl-CoA dehydrogenase family protein [Desulfobacterium sp.]
MNILNYSEDHMAFRQGFKQYIETHVSPHGPTWEANGIVPPDAWKRMGEAGYLCTWVPEQYHGKGLDFLYSVIVMEELVKAGQSGFMASLHSDIIVPYIASYGSDAIKEKYLPGCVSGEIITAVAMTEPNAGSDLTAMAATVVEDDNGYILNGSKTFISNGINCNLAVIAARDPKIDDPYAALSLFVVADGTPGFTKGNKLAKMGLRSQDTAELFFSDCRIPKENLLGQKGNGFMMLMEKLQQERLVCAVSAVAGAEAVVEHTIDQARSMKNAMGKPLTKAQDVTFALVEMTTRIKMARTFVDMLVADHMDGKNMVIETSMAKYHTTDTLKEITYRAMDLLGEFGLDDTSFLARSMRDGRIMTIFAGTNEIMKEICAKFMGL